MPSRRLLPLLALVLAACDRGPATPFDGDQAYRYVQTQLDFGPRVPGTEGHRRAGDWIVDQMRERADTVVVQEWSHVTAGGDTLPMRNVLARFRPEAAERVLFLAHWDTRPRSDADHVADPLRRQLPVPGANDGASGTAVLLALADVLDRTPPAYGVDLLFVDGEDYGDFDTGRDVLIGSRWFAAHPPEPGYQPIFGVLFDMVGDADLQIHPEGYSVQGAPEVVARVWETARELGHDEYFRQPAKWTITDDHVPLLERGWRVIDVIDMDYPREGVPSYHHTPDDTIDKVSPESLQVVGDVAVRLVVPE